MRLHYADNSDERGQYALLRGEGCLNTLGSYHYLKNNTASREFEKLWAEQVRLHLVVDTGVGTGIQQEAVEDSDAQNRLYSYQYEKGRMNLHLAGHCTGETTSQALGAECAEQHLLTYGYRQQEEREPAPVLSREDLRPRVLIDSGAFTAWSSGKPINPLDYAEWAIRFDARWREKMAALHFINLDVIGDQIGTWKNQGILEDMGLRPLPVVTHGADLKHLTRALERYEYICLGGLVPLCTSRKKMRAWLDHCFAEIMRYHREEGKLRRVHLLGVTQGWVLNRYPCYSTDSSAWTRPLRYGHGERAGIKERLPRYKDGAAQLAATLNSLRAEIRHFKKMEEDATRLWARRGIVFEEEPCLIT